MNETTTDPSPLLWKLPLLSFLLFIPFCSYIDLEIAYSFLETDIKFHAPNWCLWIYNYGIIPGQIFFLGACALFILSFFRKKAFHLRHYALYTSLTLIIGSGFFGHALFKQFWERPRPKQLTIFGGKYPYCPLLSPYKGSSDRFLRSLPSGHVTMGFCFFTLYFIGRRTSRKWLSRAGILIPTILGGILSWARIAQGGHFFSDIVVSFMIMWMTAYWLDAFFARRAYTPLPHGTVCQPSLQNSIASSMPYKNLPLLTAILPPIAN